MKRKKNSKDKDKDIDIEVLRDKDIPVLHGKDLEKAIELSGIEIDKIRWVYECPDCGNIFDGKTEEDRLIFKEHGIRYHKINYFADMEKLNEEFDKKYKNKDG